MILLSVMAACGAAALGAAAQDGTPHPWTHVVVLSGAFDTTKSGLEAVRDATDPASDCPTVVLHDGPAMGDTVAYRARYCPRDQRTKAGCKAGGSESIALGDISPDWQGEIDLGDPETLRRWLLFAQAHYPANQLLVTLKGRSDFGFVLRDDDASATYDAEVGLSIDGVALALRALKEARGENTEVVVLASSASASVEYAWALLDVADVLVATEESVSDGRMAYFRLPVWAVKLRSEPLISARALAKAIAWTYRDPSYPSFDPALPYAITAFDLKLMPALAERFGADITTLLASGGQGQSVLATARRGVWQFGELGTRVDLGGFVTSLGTAASANGLDGTLGARTGLALAAIKIDHFAMPENGATGLSLFFPADAETTWELGPRYEERFGGFGTSTGWSPLLAVWVETVRRQASGCHAALPAWPAAVMLLWLCLWCRRR
jgi:hypothetical protein